MGLEKWVFLFFAGDDNSWQWRPEMVVAEKIVDGVVGNGD